VCTDHQSVCGRHYGQLRLLDPRLVDPRATSPRRVRQTMVRIRPRSQVSLFDVNCSYFLCKSRSKNLRENANATIIFLHAAHFCCSDRSGKLRANYCWRPQNIFCGTKE